MVVITAEQPICAHEKLTIFVVHWLTMRGAPQSWVDRRCCFQSTWHTVVAMRGTLETVRAAPSEGKKAGAVDFFFGGDIIIELGLGSAGEDLRQYCLVRLIRT